MGDLAHDIFRGPPQLQEWQRQLIQTIPYVGPAYMAGRGINALVQYMQHLGQGGGTGGSTFVDPTDPNNPNNYTLPGQGSNGSAAPPTAGSAPNLGGRPTYSGSDNNAFNAWRSPFSQTFQQAMNPGSAVGPFGGGLTVPYTGQFFHPTMGASREMSPAAAAFSQYINSRNIR
jgi:hypothetical protein